MLKRLIVSAVVVFASAIAPLAVASAGASAGVSDIPAVGSIIVNNGTYAGSLPSACATAPFTTIQAAVSAATSGTTIYVCAGTYNENVSIAKPLTLDGAQYLTNAVGRSGAPESVISGSNGVTYVTGATSGSLNGFTLNSSTTYSEIYAANVGSGWTFTNNIIDASLGAIYMNTNGLLNPAPTTISGNEFVQSVPASFYGDNYDGSAVALWGNTSNNVTISGNDMLNLTGPDADINTTGTGSCDGTGAGSSTGLKIVNNSFEENGSGIGSGNNFLALFCTSNAVVSNNHLTITDPNDVNAESPIYLGGGDIATTVSNNVEVGNGASAAAGVEFNTAFYPVDNATVSNNSITGFHWGVLAYGGYGTNYSDTGVDSFAAPTGFVIKNNAITNSTYGIEMLSDGSTYPMATSPSNLPFGGSILGNTISSSATDDCIDQSSGTQTAGTANTWSGNLASSSSPTGLCATSPISVTVSGTQTFGSSSPSFSDSSSAPAGVTVSGTPVCTKVNGTQTISSSLPVASYTLVATSCSGVSLSGPLAADYSVSYSGGPFSVTQATQTITITSTAPTGAYVGGPKYSITATASSGLPVIFGSASQSTCTTTQAGLVTFIGQGTCNLVAFQLGNANYASANPVVQSFHVYPQVAPSFSSDASSDTVEWLKSFTTTVTATGIPTPTVSVVGLLPLGVTATPGAGGTIALSGKPLLPGIYPIIFKATNSAGTTYFTYFLVVGL